MAFGNLITDGTQAVVGTYGYIVTFDLTLQDIRNITQVQLQKNATTLSPAIVDLSTFEELSNYCEDSDCPDIAFCQTGNIVNIFLKTTTYPYDATVRIAFWFQRNAQNVSATTDYLDIPVESRTLFRALVLENVYLTKELKIPFDVQETIKTERANLGLNT
jgi:hypothetical protein